MADRVFEKKIQMAADYFFLNKASEVFILTNIDLLITNLIIFDRLDASFPNKMADMSKSNVKM